MTARRRPVFVSRYPAESSAAIQNPCRPIAAGASDEVRRQALDYGSHLGLAFQVRDDILDVTADQAELGKPIGSDRAEGKRTFADLLGLEGCAALVAEETRLAKEVATVFKNSAFLLNLADSLAERRA